MNRIVALSLACFAIAACSKSDGVQIGTGQDPDPVIIEFPIAYIKAPIPTDATESEGAFAAVAVTFHTGRPDGTRSTDGAARNPSRHLPPPQQTER